MLADVPPLAEIVIAPVDALTEIPVPAVRLVTPALVSVTVPEVVIVPPPDIPVPAATVMLVTVPPVPVADNVPPAKLTPEPMDTLLNPPAPLPKRIDVPLVAGA